MLSIATLKSRWTSFAGTFVAVFLGVAILSMTGLVLMSAQPEIPERYAGTQVYAQSAAVGQEDGTFTDTKPWSPERTAELVKAFEAIPGVQKAVPDRNFYAQAVIDGKPVGDQDSGNPQGHSWSSAALAPYSISEGNPPSKQDDVVVEKSLGVSPGSKISLLTGDGPKDFTVTGTVDAPGFYVTDATAAKLASGVRIIGLVTAPDADLAAVESAAKAAQGTDGRVLAGAARTGLELKGDERVRWIGQQILVAMGSLGGFVSIFVVASTFAFSVVQRRRELGLLRTIGATPKQVKRMMFGEAIAIGVVAGIAGMILGTAMAPLLGNLLVSAGLQPANFAVKTQAAPLLGSFVAGLAVAVAGVWAAGRRASQIRPLEALREAAVDKKPMTRARWIAGGAVSGIGALLLLVTMLSSSEDMITNALYSAMALIVGMTLLAPVIIPPVVRTFTLPLARRDGAVGMLVREGSLAAVRRTASTAAPVLVTVGLAVLIAGMFETRASGYALDEAVSTRADSVVVPQGTPGLSAAAVQAIPGTSLLPTELYGPEASHFGAIGVTPEEFTKARSRLTVLSGSLDDLKGSESVVLNESTAKRLNVQTGQSTPLTFEDGKTVDLKVVAVITDNSAATQALLPRQTVREHDPSALTSAVYIVGSAPSQIGAELGAEVMDMATYAAAVDAEEDRLVRIFIIMLIGMSLGYTALAIANTLMMATADRKRDFAVLRLTGATNRQVLKTVAAESVLVVGIGTLLGLTVAVIALFGIKTGLSQQLGTTVSMTMPWGVIFSVVTICLLLALIASVLPARLALQAAREAR
ncbi:putative ABC transport system permease protein [Saccharothrix coeruleofusca]|uniref:FtsX-like permease family protein n=1 Tax=Saccharothrix coeruleofusca TaxID=33919 RepID=UPI001AE159C5|nr:FtsX-like permease family protein [Saccharothrix coeruleofusca]MBP2334779.1 putative ABC transport system permease protein [Saccharothrix coeruleofusca]